MRRTLTATRRPHTAGLVVTLVLTNTADGWRLSDIRGPDGARLVEELKRLNAAS